MNFGRKMMKAGVAAVAAIATLGAGGVVASTAFAGGGGGNQPGTGGDLAAVQFWQYKDDASGAWGPATSLDSVRAAMNNAGVTLEGDGVTKAQAQSTYSGVSSYSGGAYRRTEGSTSGSNTYRGTTSGGSGPAAAAPKPNLNGAYGCGNSCTGKDDGYYHH